MRFLCLIQTCHMTFATYVRLPYKHGDPSTNSQSILSHYCQPFFSFGFIYAKRIFNFRRVYPTDLNTQDVQML